MTRPAQEHLRTLPSVDRVLIELGETDLPRPLVTKTIRRTLAEFRRSTRPADLPAVLAATQSALDQLRRTRIQPLINATGIIIHTNLGRSPLAPAAAAAMADIALHYNNLEYDLDTGQRGARGTYVEQAVAALCNAERAAIVNNCAAALVLILHHYAGKSQRNRVIVSRGELIQIGGGFRIPDILAASGAALAEIGTTNKTTLNDYRETIDDRTALILRVHRSNFFMGGFVEEPTSADIARLARAAELPFAEDLGSGAIFDTATLGGNEQERTPAQAIADGADLVCFSGDKLLGGPQAGIIVGRESAIAALKSDPLYRALRCDKLILTALQTTADLLLVGQTQHLPIRAMMQLSTESLHSRANQIIAALTDLPLKAAVGRSRSQVGGGSLPRTQIQSATIDLLSDQLAPAQLAAALREQSPPVIGYLADDALHLDLRTVFPQQDQQLIAAVRAAASAKRC